MRFGRILLFCAIVGTVEAVTLDANFNAGQGTDTFVEQALPLPEDNVIICGAFTQYNGAPAPYLARLNENGTLDPAFRHGVNGWVRHLVRQPDGKLVIGGAFTQVEGQPRELIARLHPDGTLDTSFNPGSGFRDKVVAADTNAPYVFWLALQPDGKILVIGSFAKYNDRTVNGIVRLNPDGTIDQTFRSGSGLNSWGRFVTVQPNRQILLSGWFTSYDGAECNRLVRLNEDGTLDRSFLPYFGDKTAIYCAMPLSDGKMLVSGHSKSDFNMFKRGIARLKADGSEDATFAGHTNERTECLLLQGDGRILASGWFTLANGENRQCIARFDADGTLDGSFVADADFFIWSMAFDSKGRLLVAGGFQSIGGLDRTGVARLVNLDSSSVTPMPEPKSLVMRTPGFQSGRFRAAIASEVGKSYCLEYCDRFSAGSWNALPIVTGDGGEITLTDPSPSWQRFYRVRVIE